MIAEVFWRVTQRWWWSTTSSLVLVAVLLGLIAQRSHAKGPGLAFPISSENFAIDTFKRTNPSIVSQTARIYIGLYINAIISHGFARVFGGGR